MRGSLKRQWRVKGRRHSEIQVRGDEDSAQKDGSQSYQSPSPFVHRQALHPHGSEKTLPSVGIRKRDVHPPLQIVRSKRHIAADPHCLELLDAFGINRCW